MRVQPKGGSGTSEPTIEERVSELRRIVDLLIRQMEGSFEVELDHHPRSVAYLDAVIAELRRADRPLTPSLFLSIGGYVGEILIHTYDGEWTELDGHLAVTIDGGAHTATFRVFDWVKQAYSDPNSSPMSERLAWAVSDPASHGSTESSPSRDEG